MWVGGGGACRFFFDVFCLHPTQQHEKTRVEHQSADWNLNFYGTGRLEHFYSQDVKQKLKNCQAKHLLMFIHSTH